MVTNSCNCFKTDIIKYLKFWYGRLKPKAFEQSINLNVNNLYKEEIAAKAAAKAAAKKDFNAQSNVD